MKHRVAQSGLQTKSVATSKGCRVYLKTFRIEKRIISSFVTFLKDGRRWLTAYLPLKKTQRLCWERID